MLAKENTPELTTAWRHNLITNLLSQVIFLVTEFTQLRQSSTATLWHVDIYIFNGKYTF